jgi:hypothetical protein
MVTLLPGKVAEQTSFWSVVRAFQQFLAQQKINVVFLPSYWPANSAALLFAAASKRVRAVMMNESHAGTENATGVKRVVDNAYFKE